MKNAFTGTTTPVNQTDWAKLRAMKSTEIVCDEEAPRTQATDWEGAVMRRDGVELGRVPGKGRQKVPAKVLLSVQYSLEVVEYFRATGDGWQARMDNALKEWIKLHPAH